MQKSQSESRISTPNGVLRGVQHERNSFHALLKKLINKHHSNGTRVPSVYSIPTLHTIATIVDHFSLICLFFFRFSFFYFSVLWLVAGGRYGKFDHSSSAAKRRSAVGIPSPGWQGFLLPTGAATGEYLLEMFEQKGRYIVAISRKLGVVGFSYLL